MIKIKIGKEENLAPKKFKSRKVYYKQGSIDIQIKYRDHKTKFLELIH